MHDSYLFVPEWGAVPGLLPSEGLALSRSYVVEAPSIKANPLLNKLILQGSDIGVPNSMHTKVSKDQCTHAETKELKIKRGRRASSSGAPPPWEPGAPGDEKTGESTTKRAAHRKYTIGPL